MARKVKILFLCAPIEDFTLLGGWLVPYGGWSIASHLRACGADVRYIDALYRHDSAMASLSGYWPPKTQGYGIGAPYKSPAVVPPVLSHIPMHWRSYGMPVPLLVKEAVKTGTPDLICVTSGLCYHYVGLFKLIRELKVAFPSVPVVLGGIYATLCRDHALKYSGADHVVSGEGESQIVSLVDSLFPGTLVPQPPFDLNTKPLPDLSLYLERGKKIDAVAFMTSRGCPFGCHYCASGLLQKYRRMGAPRAIEFFKKLVPLGIRNVVFYDDALLLAPEDHFDRIMSDVVQERLPLYFHCPNSIHARMITPARARLMFSAGFRTIRLSIETVNAERMARSGKVTCDEMRNACEALVTAGFAPRNISVYYMVGAPGQAFEDMVDTMAFVSALGVSPMPLPYSLIPGTQDWKDKTADGTFPPDADPLLSNKEVLPFAPPGKGRGDIKKILRLARVVRSFGKYGLNLFGDDEVAGMFRERLQKCEKGGGLPHG